MMKTLSEALFSRKNLRELSIDELYSHYDLVVLEYLTHDVNTAFMIFDNVENASDCIVKDIDGMIWYNVGERGINILSLKGFFDSVTHPVKFYCKKISPKNIYGKLDKFFGSVHNKKYNVEKTRKQILDLLGTYIEFDPTEINME